MYAVIRTGGKQYRVKQGDLVEVELLSGEKGQSIELSEVLMVEHGGEYRIGAPLVEGATVTAEIKDIFKADKVMSLRRRRRKGVMVKRGHRQSLTRLLITRISL